VPFDFTQRAQDPMVLYTSMRILIGWAILILKGEMTSAARASYRKWRQDHNNKILHETGQTTVWRRGETLTTYVMRSDCPLPLFNWGDGSIPVGQNGRLPCADHYFNNGQTPHHLHSRREFARYLFGDFLDTAAKAIPYQPTGDDDHSASTEWAIPYHPTGNDDHSVEAVFLTGTLGKLSLDVLCVATQMRLDIPDEFRTQATLLSDQPDKLGEWVKTWVDKRNPFS
jgi:hypothetical protein